MTDDNSDRCLRCHNLSEVLIEGFCEGCCDALGRRRPRIRKDPEAEKIKGAAFEIVVKS